MLVTTVESTTLASVAYDRASRVLRLEFRSLAIYCYFDVPAAIYEGLMTAESKGSYFNTNIRGRFHYQRERQDQAAASLS
jgi:hypothetical protein